MQPLVSSLASLAEFYFHLLGILGGCSATILVLTLGFKRSSPQESGEPERVTMASIGMLCSIFACIATAFLYSFACITKGEGIIILFGLATGDFLLSALVFIWSLLITVQVLSKRSFPADISIWIFGGIILAGLTYLGFIVWWLFKAVNYVAWFILPSIALFILVFRLGILYRQKLSSVIPGLAKCALILVPVFIVITGIVSMFFSLSGADVSPTPGVTFLWMILLDIVAGFLIFTYVAYGHYDEKHEMKL